MPWANAVSMDKELLEDFLERVADKYSAQELVELLEDAGAITVWDIISFLDDIIIENREKLEV